MVVPALGSPHLGAHLHEQLSKHVQAFPLALLAKALTPVAIMPAVSLLTG